MNPEKIKTGKIKKVISLILISILVAGSIAAFYFFREKPKARKRHALITKTIVEVKKLKKSDVPVTFSVYGSVIPAKEVSLTSQIPGRVKSVNPDFRPGGLLKKGVVAVTLEGEDYASAVLKKKAALEQALADLELEKANQKVARNEWDVYKKFKDTNENIDSYHILRKPQLEKALAVVSAAKADLEQAELDYSKTRIVSPFDAIVRSKKIDVGSQVTVQSEMGILTGTDEYWIEAAVPVNRLKLLKTGKISKPFIVTSDSEKFEGTILSVHGTVENDGQMAKLLIEVKNPMKDYEKHLLIGSLVRVELKGITFRNVFKIPRTALSEENKVFIARKDNTLEIRAPEIRWKDTDWVYISDGLYDNELLITTNIPVPVNGIPLEIRKRKRVKKRVKIKRLKDSENDKDKEED